VRLRGDLPAWALSRFGENVCRMADAGNDFVPGENPDSPALQFSPMQFLDEAD